MITFEFPLFYVLISINLIACFQIVSHKCMIPSHNFQFGFLILLKFFVCLFVVCFFYCFSFVFLCVDLFIFLFSHWVINYLIMLANWYIFGCCCCQNSLVTLNNSFQGKNKLFPFIHQYAMHSNHN